MRQTPAAICATLSILVILVAGLCTTPTSSAATRDEALRYNVIGHQTTPGVTPTPTPTPSDTPTTTFTPTTTISGRTFTTYTVPAGTHDVLYEDCTFTGGSADVDRGGVLTINRSAYNIVFRDCTIESGPGNGIKIVDAGGTVHDIRFEGCLIKSQPRMGFECISRPPSGSSACYTHIDLIDCTFEPQGSEAISYDSAAATVNARGYCLIDGVVIKGSGTNLGVYPWGQGLEINNVHNMTVRNTTIYRTGQSTLNLDTANSTFTDCTFDMSVNYIGAVSKDRYDAIVDGNITDCVFTRCTLKAGDQGYIGYLSASSNNDFRTCSFLGADDFHKRVVRTNGSSGNLWPSGTVLVRQ